MISRRKAFMTLVVATATLFNPLVIEHSKGAVPTKIKLAQVPQIISANTRIAVSAQVVSASSRNVGWQGKLQISKDDGETWSTQKLTKGTVIKANSSGRFDMEFKVTSGEFALRVSAENKLKNQKAFSNVVSFTADSELKYFSGVEINGDPEDLTSDDSFVAFFPSGFYKNYDSVVVALEALIDDEFVTIDETEASGDEYVTFSLMDLDGEYDLYISIILGEGEEVLTRYQLGTFNVTGI